MKRNILDENTPTVYEGILKAPSIGETMGAYRMSTSSNQTFATTTTRASSVMPPARPNLGISASMNENMTAEEAREYYGNTAYGQKNQEVTGNSVLPMPVATTINQQTREAQDNAIKARNDKEDELKIEAEREKKRKRRRLYFFLGLLGLVALVAIAGGAFASLGQSDERELDETNNRQEDDPGDENSPPLPEVTPNPTPANEPPPPVVNTSQPTLNPTFLPSLQPTTNPSLNPSPAPSVTEDPNIFELNEFFLTSESNFEFLCKEFESLMEGHIFCLGSSFLLCQGGDVTSENDCGCDCPGQLSAPFTCPVEGNDPDATCQTNVQFPGADNEEKLLLKEIEIFTNDCRQNVIITPQDLCIFEDQTLICSPQKGVQVFTCESDCGCNINNDLFCQSTCVNALIPLEEAVRFADINNFRDFCSLVATNRDFARCAVGGNGRTINLCPGSSFQQDTTVCISPDKCICETGGIVFIDDINDVEGSVCDSPGESNSCPGFEITVPLAKADELLSLLVASGENI